MRTEGVMKQGNNRRSRSRGGGKRNQGGRGHNFESTGSEVKIRGNAQQLQEKYLALARDASSAGDRIAAESFLQYADHYHRVLNQDGNGAQRHQQRGPDQQRGDMRQPQIPQGTGPQPVIGPAAAIAAQAPERKDGETQPLAAPPPARVQD
jgi:hypothetical protein